MAVANWRILTVLLLGLPFTGCPYGWETVPGPETQGLRDRLDGYLVRAQGSQMEAFSLPDLKRTVVLSLPVHDRDGAFHYRSIHALSGPDAQGRIAYVEGEETKYSLKTIHIDGNHETEILSRPGNADWATTAAGKGEIGEHLALAPRGGRVAFLSQGSSRQMPGAQFFQANIEVWDVAKKQRLPVRCTAIDQPMSWFPDGKRLANVAMVPRKELPRTGISVNELTGGDYVKDWDALPAVHIFDTDSGQSRVLTLGWWPVVAFDGKTVLVGSWVSVLAASGATRYTDRGYPDVRLVWHRVDVETGKATGVTWPGGSDGAIAQPADDLVLYLGWPTKGQPIKHSTAGSFRAGLELVTIKVAVMDSNRFQTLIPEHDPRDRVSYGRGK